jgi:hypothetical protein
MKNNFALILLIIIISLSFSSCKKEYKTKTVIHEDGSCERTVKLISDDKEINFKDVRFPVPSKGKNGWIVKEEKESNDSSKYVYTAYKKFAQLDELNKEYNDKNKYGVEVSLDKKFRWFYTFMEYKETYKKYFPFNNIILKEYLTADEYQKYKSGDTSKVIKDRIDEFMMKNLLAEFWKNLKDSLNVKHPGIISYESVYAKKNEIENWMKSNDKIFSDHELNEASLGKILNIKDVNPLFEVINSIVDNITKEFVDSVTDDGDYTNTVAMPGIITASNSTSIKGNEAEWKLNVEKFCFDDFAMTVESRVTNAWAFIITGIAVTILLVLLIIPGLRKRTQLN